MIVYTSDIHATGAVFIVGAVVEAEVADVVDL